ncbi:MAG: NUDIX domain-containing protein [Cellulosilyticaceae bacterium]
MHIRPRAAAIIVNDKKELLLLRQKNPYTGFEWWTLPGGGMEPEESVIDTIVREVEEECNVSCRPMKLIYISEYVDYSIDTHHLGMFFLTQIDDESQIQVGSDPEVEEQYIKECRFVSKEEIQHSKLPIYPPVFRQQFWDDLENDFKEHEVYQRGMITEK